MMQFHLSQAAAKDLQAHLQPAAPVDYQQMQWYLHRVTVARRKCVVAMELQSRYAMVFCGLTKPDFADFPALFAERLLREVLVHLDNAFELDDAQVQSLLALGHGLAADQYHQTGSDRSVTAHIKDVALLLRILVEEEGYSLPVDEREAMVLGIEANTTPRKSKDHKDYFFPLEMFIDFWAGLFSHMTKTPLVARAEQLADEPGSNVIEVDFQNKK